MRILRYSILVSILWALPSFVLAYFSPGLGSASSYLTSFLLVAYYIIIKDKGPLPWVFILLGLTYYFIAGLQYTGLSGKDYIILIVKYLIVIIGGAEVLRRTSLQELYIVLIFGGLSIVINTMFFPLYNAHFTPVYGRYSGFYLNPNHAGAICLIGLALNFGVKSRKLKYLGFLVFTLAGFFTFSRYFLAMFLVINMIMVYNNKKYLIAPILGAIGLFVIFTFGSSLNLNTQRFNAFKSIFSNKEKIDTETLEEDSRTETWATYKDIVMDQPLFGHGYGKLQGNHFGHVEGVHNTYLMVIGEAGIIPFFILIGICFFFLRRGFSYFKTKPEFSILALVLVTALLVSHTYFDKFSLLFISLYLYFNLTDNIKVKDSSYEEIPNYYPHLS
jgi:O-antigen ligase